LIKKDIYIIIILEILYSFIIEKMQEEIKNVNRPKLFPDDFYDDQ